MMPTNSDWEERTTVKKGNYGEKLVNNLLEKEGFIMYMPTTPGKHAFDRLAIKGKKDILMVECKSKAKRKWVDDTGIDIRHFKDYTYISNKHHLYLFIFFIDEYLGEIYGNYLHKLTKPKVIGKRTYPLEEKGIIYFPMCNMKRNLAKLNGKDVDFLVNNSTRSYDY